MNTVQNAEIINYEGTTCLLRKPEVVEGITYPFAFDAIVPKEKSWSYRLCVSRDPSALTNAALAELLRTVRSELRAEWEEQVGHAIGFITISIPQAGGGAANRQRVPFEKGPDLDMVKQIEPKLRPLPTPQPDRERMPPPPPPPEIDISF